MTQIRTVAATLLLACLLPVPIGAHPQDQELEVPPTLAAGGTIFLKNDMQAARESMTVFREFRRLMKRVDRFDVVDKEDEAELIAILSGDRDVLGRGEFTNQGLPYPNGYSSTKPMILLVYDADSSILLWFDAEPWETRGNTGNMVSHERLVKRLAAALEEAGQGL
jgi:hypothetical protein